jgi:PAS domain-containing protein
MESGKTFSAITPKIETHFIAFPNSGIAADAVLFYSDAPVVNPGTTLDSQAALSAPVSSLASLSLIEQLFDHVPDTVFFLKDVSGRYVAVNQSLVERCGVENKNQLIGRRVHDVFPPDLARRYAAQDEAVLGTGRPIVDRLELHWYERRRAGWCLTTKLALRDSNGEGSEICMSHSFDLNTLP